MWSGNLEVLWKEKCACEVAWCSHMQTVAGHLAGSMFCEIRGCQEREDKEPGNFGDPLGLDMYTIEMRNKDVELEHF
eukprot:4055596-Amphidinium_carterae.1